MMSDVTTHKENPIGRIAVVGRVKDAIVAYEGALKLNPNSDDLGSSCATDKQ